MTNKGKLKDRARDELFSHINRCGVLGAAEEHQTQWMDETMEYLAERYPDLSDPDLKELYTLGMRFCRPAIPHGHPSLGSDEAGEVEASASAPSTSDDQEVGDTVGATTEESTLV
jgi:hypothetical protein